MIERAIPFASGDAVRLVFSADAVAAELPIRVLRRSDANFIGPDDPDAALLLEGVPGDVAIDLSVANGQAYSYKAYAWDELADAFVDNDDLPVTATPQAWYEAADVDLRALVRQRMDRGLQQEAARGLLRLKRVVSPRVLLGPPVFDSTEWPVLSVHVTDDTDAEHGLGAELAGIGDDQSRLQGWLSSGSLQVIAWSQNPDERHALYLAMKRVLIANVDVFEALGIQNLSARFTDQDYVSGEYPAPVFTCVAALRATLPSAIKVPSNPADPIINDVSVSATPSRLCAGAFSL